MAAQNLCMLLGTASEFVVGKRSWLDRVRNDFDPMAAFSWKRVEGDLVVTDHILLRGASDVDAFARAHAETIRNAADIVNRYASDVSNLANAVAPGVHRRCTCHRRCESGVAPTCRRGGTGPGKGGRSRTARYPLWPTSWAQDQLVLH